MRAALIKGFGEPTDVLEVSDVPSLRDRLRVKCWSVSSTRRSI